MTTFFMLTLLHTVSRIYVYCLFTFKDTTSVQSKEIKLSFTDLFIFMEQILKNSNFFVQWCLLLLRNFKKCKLFKHIHCLISCCWHTSIAFNCLSCCCSFYNFFGSHFTTCSNLPVLKGRLPFWRLSPFSRLISKSPVFRETCSNFQYFVKSPVCITSFSVF